MIWPVPEQVGQVRSTVKKRAPYAGACWAVCGSPRLLPVPLQEVQDTDVGTLIVLVGLNRLLMFTKIVAQV